MIRLLRWLNLASREQTDTRESTGALVLYVRCDYCGEIVRARIDLRSDLAQEFDDGVSGYTLRKEILGSACNRVMTLRMAFDRCYGIKERNIEGGKFATPQEYETYRVSAEPVRRRYPGAGLRG